MAISNEHGVFTNDGRKNCGEHTCQQEHVYVEEGYNPFTEKPKYVWRVHK